MFSWISSSGSAPAAGGRSRRFFRMTATQAEDRGASIAPRRGRRRPAPGPSACPWREDDPGAKALLGMRSRAQDDIDQHRGVGTDHLGVMAGAPKARVTIPPMGAGHVLGDGGWPMWAPAAAIAGDALAAVKDL